MSIWSQNTQLPASQVVVEPVSKKRKRSRTENQKDFARLSRSTIATAITPKAVRRLLPYSQTVYLDTALSSIEYVFRGNSCFDPDYTGVGSQPAGFDSYAALYGNYRVHGSKITVAAISWATSAHQAAGCISITPSRDAGEGALTTAAALVKQNEKHAFFGPASGSRQIATVKHKAITSTTYGVKDLSDSGFAAVFTNSPNLEWYWDINMTLLDGTSTFTSYPIIIQVNILYDVEFFNVDRLGLS